MYVGAPTGRYAGVSDVIHEFPTFDMCPGTDAEMMEVDIAAVTPKNGMG
jgi:hypothetical protein